MKYLSLVSIILSTSLTFTSCEKAEITEDSQNQPTEKQTGKAYKVNVMARSASASAITYPVTIYAKDNEGNVAAQQTINSATDEISLQLTSGSYTITAISGSTDFSSGYSTTPLLIGHSDITVSDASTSVNILLSYAVASLNVTMSNIPSDVTEVSLTISNQYTSVSTDGEYSGSGKCVIPCTKSGSNWTTGTVYVLPGCGSNTVMSFTVTSPLGTETYGLTYSSSLKASTPYTFVGIYDGSTDVSTVKVTGTLACGEWEKEIQSSFSFGPNGTNSFDDAVEVSSYTVSELPAQGSLWNGHVVAYIDGNDALLLSLQEWSDLTSAYYEADPDVAKNIAASYSEGDISIEVSPEELLEHFDYGDIVLVSLGERGAVLATVANGPEGNQGDFVLSATPGLSCVELFSVGKCSAVELGIMNEEERETGTHYELNEGITLPLPVYIYADDVDTMDNQSLVRHLQDSISNNRDDYPGLSDEDFANFRAVSAPGLKQNWIYRSTSAVRGELGRNDYVIKLAEDAGVELVYVLIGQTLQTLITLVEYFVGLSTQCCNLLRIGNNDYLALINNGAILALNLGIQNFTDVLGTEACSESSGADADTYHVTLTGMHDTFSTVDEVVELTLENRLKVALDVLTGNLNLNCQIHLAARLKLVNIGTKQFNLVVFHSSELFGLNQLEAVKTGTIDINMGVLLTDDFTFEGGGVSNGDINVGNLQLDIAGFQRGLNPLLNVLLQNQALGNSPVVMYHIVGDDGEAQSNSAGAAANGDVSYRSESVNKGTDTVEGVIHVAVPVAGGNSTENHSGANYQRDNMANRPDILTYGNNTNLEVVGEVKTGANSLVNDTADEEYKDTSGLIALNQSHSLFVGVGFINDNNKAGDITGNQRNTKFTNFGVGQVAVIYGAFVGGRSLNIFAGFNNLCCHSGGNTGLEDVGGVQLSTDHTLDVFKGILQVGQSGNLFAGISQRASAVVSGFRLNHGCVFTAFSDDGVQVCFSLGEHFCGTAQRSIK